MVNFIFKRSCHNMFPKGRFDLMVVLKLKGQGVIKITNNLLTALIFRSKFMPVGVKISCSGDGHFSSKSWTNGPNDQQHHKY